MSAGDFPKTVEEIYDDFSKRRQGLVRALIDDVEDFYSSCDPERENLCLYGLRDGTWSVDLPADEVPPELPEPCLGINFARDGMQKRDWLRLFKLMNQQPTLFEMVTNRSTRAKEKAQSGGAPMKKRKPESSTSQGRPHEAPYPSGRLLLASDINPGLKGRQGELFWPDNKMWYLVEIQSINFKTKQAKIAYASGEVEDLDLDEIIREGHMTLL